MSLTDEGRSKFDSMKELVRRAYYESSIIPLAVTPESFDPSRHVGEFSQLPYRPRLDSEMFNDPTVVMDLVFGEIGRGIAASEQRILVEEIDNLAPSQGPVDQVFPEIIRAMTDLVLSQHIPSVLFAPVEYYMDWHWDWMVAHQSPSIRFISENGHSFLQVGSDAMVRVIWSSKLAPFDDFFLVDRRWATWICKPTIEQRFRIDRLGSNELDLAYRVIYRLVIEDRSAIRRVRTTRTGPRSDRRPRPNTPT